MQTVSLVNARACPNPTTQRSSTIFRQAIVTPLVCRRSTPVVRRQNRRCNAILASASAAVSAAAPAAAGLPQAYGYVGAPQQVYNLT